MSSNKTRRDLFLATLAHLLQKAAGYVVLLLLTRHLPKEEVGAFFFTAAVASFFALVTDLGTSRYLVREVAAAPERAGELLGRVLAIRLPMLAVACALVGALAVALQETPLLPEEARRPDLWVLIVLSAAYVFAEDLFYAAGSVLLGVRRVQDWVVAMIINRTLLVALVAAAVLSGAGLKTILACHVAASVALLAMGLGRVWLRVGRTELRIGRAETVELVRGCLPFFVLTVLSLLHFKADTLMLGAMSGYVAVATYEAAYKLLEVSRFLVRPMAMVYYPLCSQLAAQEAWGEFVPLFRRLVLVTGGAGVAVAVVVIAGADVILPIAFGEQYRDSAGTLRVLFLGAPLLFVEFVTMFVAQSLRLERRAIVVTAVSLVANVAINAVAIPRYGPIGAAWATVVTQGVLTVGLVVMVFGRAKVLAGSAKPQAGAGALGVVGGSG